MISYTSAVFFLAWLCCTAGIRLESRVSPITLEQVLGLRAILFESLGLTLLVHEFVVAIQFWLGVPVFSGPEMFLWDCL